MKIKCLPLISGISGLSLSDEESTFFKANKVFGFILFARNIKSLEQVTVLTTSLKNLYTGQTPLIFVDQEGGRVARVKPPIAKKLYPAVGDFSNMYDDKDIETPQEKALAATKENFASLMGELKVLGFDSPCGPVADLRIKGAHDVIGDRSFGGEVAKVVALCSTAIEGIVQSGGLPVIKHMPGHGRALADSHISLPEVSTPLNDLQQTDFEVFRQLSKHQDVKYAMTAHIMFPAIDPDFPITCSKKGIEFIRKDIGFKGIILTDAIEMKALHGEIGARSHFVERAINLLTNQKPLAKDDSDALVKYSLIGEDFFEKTRENQIELLKAQKNEIDPSFTKSLVGASKTALESGCDVVLHCTGVFDQITAICGALNEVEFDPQLIGQSEPFECKM